MDILPQIVGSAIGASLGVVAGTFITIFATNWRQRRTEDEQIANLCFELRLNLKKIDAWIVELSRYRNAVNGDSLQRWFGYFDLTKTVSSASVAAMSSGLLYKKLSYEDIENLQFALWDLSASTERYMNDQFAAVRTEFSELWRSNDTTRWMTTAKPKAIQLADFWEARLAGHREKLQKLNVALSKRVSTGNHQ